MTHEDGSCVCEREREFSVSQEETLNQSILKKQSLFEVHTRTQ